MYVVFAITMAVLCGIVLLMCICARCPYCLCSKTGCCGGRKPHERPHRRSSLCTRVCSCGLGVESIGGGKMAYPARGRWLTRILILLFASCLTVFIIVGQVKGNNQLVPALKKVSSRVTGRINRWERKDSVSGVDQSLCFVRSPHLLPSSRGSSLHCKHPSLTQSLTL
jgi:hypothetical protein